MSNEQSLPQEPSEEEARSVRAYLAEHPDFLGKNTDILGRLQPPSRGDTPDGVEDFQRYMLSRLQEHIAAIKGEHDDLMDLMQAQLQRQDTFNDATLALLDATGFEDLIKTITETLPPILEHRSLALFFEAGAHFPHGWYGGARVVPIGFTDRYLGTDEQSLLRDDIAPAEIFLSSAGEIGSYALVRLQIDEGEPCGLLALGHRDPSYYATRLPTEQVECLAHIVERCLRRWLRG